MSYTALHKEQLDEHGYLILDNFLKQSECKFLKEYLSNKYSEKKKGKSLMPDPDFAKFLSSDKVQKAFKFALGDAIYFHHANGQKLTAFDDGKIWHHDYDAVNTVANHNMYHLMIYPDGLRLENGALVILPGSHVLKKPREYPNQFNQESISGEVVITGRPMALLMNSRLWHRRTKSCSVENRYYLNISFTNSPISGSERKKYIECLKESKLIVSSHQTYQYESL